MATLEKLIARQVLDSRGRPTVEVDAWGSDGSFGRSIVPNGLSLGRREAVTLRDEGPGTRYGGWSVQRAIWSVNETIAPSVLGFDLTDQARLDESMIALDGTPDKSNLGGNATLAVSFAMAHAGAVSRDEPLYVHLNRIWDGMLDPGTSAEPSLPMPMVGMIAGRGPKGRRLDFQDFMMVPVGASCYEEALEMAVTLYRCLAEVLDDYEEDHHLVSDDGCYAPYLRVDNYAVERILEASMRCERRIGHDVAIAVDVAANGLHDPTTGLYTLRGGGEQLDAGGMIDLLEHWCRNYPIVSIEDGLADEDRPGWAELTRRLGDRVQIVGDDLFDTSESSLLAGVREGLANAILIQPNSVGTLTETLRTMRSAHRAGYRAIVAGRSGETEDTTIADLAVATGAGQIKVGSVTRSERLAKYNRLLRIEEDLPGPDRFAGRQALAGSTWG